MLAGIDGCPGGRWAVVIADNKLRSLTVKVVEDLAPLIEDLRRGTLAAIAIDMPIGLLDDRSRASDKEARALLGPRRSSVFPTPLRCVLDAADYAEACALSRQASGKALSKQAFNLVPKIAELDALIRPDDQHRLVEAHPELAFTRLNGEPPADSKHTPAGRELRAELLCRELPTAAVKDVLGSGLAPLPDLLDAASLVTTAARVKKGHEIRLGTETDATGKRAEVVY